ncbi:MAG: hypothetical protein K5930_09055 [Treponemataceae bacterium]|nr:hypothetical protein [Treponemataceae bacterium]
MNQRDSNVIIKVDRDRECAEWLSFPDGVNYKTIVTDFNVDNSDSIKTCTELNNNKNCESNSFGTGYNNVLDVSYYISQMTGEWANKDFSGFAIPNMGSIDKKKKEMEGRVQDDSYIWQNTSTVAGSTSIFTANEKYAKDKICKSYPEKDSPYNFSDKYKVDLYKCSCESGSGVGDTCTNVSENVSYSLVDVNRDSSLWSDDKAWCVKDESDNYTKVLSRDNKVLAFTYEQFKNFVPRDYFQQVKSGITLPYEVKESYGISRTTSSGNTKYHSLIWIDDEQECYYQKFSYTDFNEPSNQYLGGGVEWNVPQEVCYSVSNKKPIFQEVYKTECGEYKIIKKQTEFNNTQNNSVSDYKQGYCVEYDYSKEIYYSGSGKYNCITWIPGYVE